MVSFVFVFCFFFSRPFTCCGAESEACWFLVLFVFHFVLFESFCVSFASSLSYGVSDRSDESVSSSVRSMAS